MAVKKIKDRLDLIEKDMIDFRNSEGELKIVMDYGDIMWLIRQVKWMIEL